MKKIIWLVLAVFTTSLNGCGGGVGGTSNGHNVSTNLGEKIGSPISKSDSTGGIENASVTATVTPINMGLRYYCTP